MAAGICEEGGGDGVALLRGGGDSGNERGEVGCRAGGIAAVVPQLDEVGEGWEIPGLKNGVEEVGGGLVGWRSRCLRCAAG